MKQELRNKAKALRLQGYSYSQINELIPVSKSTLSLWLKDIRYVPNKSSLEKIKKSREKITAHRKNAQSVSLENAQKLAKSDIGNLSDRDIFMLGIGIYIGEGTKSNGIIRIINANPSIIRFAMTWLKTITGLSDENFRLRLHLYPDNNVRASEDYWSGQLGLPKKFFHKTYIDIRTNKKLAKRGKLPYGTGHLSIVSNGKPEHGVFLFRRIKAWMDLVLEK
ncbi:MAG: hypothetical protein KA028_02895 [Candidatus Pacebacteria bacterium]|nr:hypothetical protein [Candidatus Paceibacterota bacterium]MBP9852327.1 hypothetical protein [Candidatus Paceibacterota bacterium]